jgi:hypothetical protein
MIPDNLQNAYSYEIERRKDEMREAAKSQLARQARQGRNSSARPFALVSILARLLTILLGR